MRKHRNGNFFEDFRLGQRLVHGTPRTLSSADQSLYIALTGSRTPLACAETAALAAGMRRRPLEDLLVFNVAFGKTVPDVSLNAVANLGYAELRFMRPVFDGDTIGVESEVIGLKENSNGRTGVVYVRSIARDQAGTVVLSWVRWVMVHKRDPQSRAADSHVPVLATQVEPTTMAFESFQTREIARIAAATQCPDLWDDYEVGERIDHPSAMAVNDSDHSLATRLYQNTARAHFDAFGMAKSSMGKRLVYGGHVISLCKALSYDGLENVVSTLAIHAGSHLAPIFAGDTICCATRIVGKESFGDSSLGGLRLRMVGAKNLDSSGAIEFPEGGRKPEHVVLDLDLTIAIPKRNPEALKP